MENQAEINGASTHDSTRKSRYPTGYRFMPTDQELIVDYLAKKVKNEPIQVDEMSEVKLYENLPEKLVENYPRLGDKEWYFFTPRDRKYPNGSRPSRSVENLGYWKATGIDKAILSSTGEIIGKKRALVFYNREIKLKTVNKSDWIMHEYRLNVVAPNKSQSPTSCSNGKELDDLVLCRIYKKPKRWNKKQKDDEILNGQNECQFDSYELYGYGDHYEMMGGGSSDIYEYTPGFSEDATFYQEFTRSDEKFVRQ